MVKLYSWLRITAIIVVIGANLIIGIESAAAQDTSQTFSGSLSTQPNELYKVTYVVRGVAGDTLNVALDFTGGTNCYGYWLLLTVKDEGYHINDSSPINGNYGTFSGSIHDTYLIPVTMDIEVGIEIICSHTYSSLVQWAWLSYLLTVSIDRPTPIIPDPIAAEVATGLQRIAVDTSLPIIIYTPTPAAAAHGDLFIDIWQLDELGIGYPTLYISADDLLALPDFPAENTLIADTSDGFIAVYKLTTGEFQVNVGPLPDGKIHVIIFDGIPPTHIYGYTWGASQ